MCPIGIESPDPPLGVIVFFEILMTNDSRDLCARLEFVMLCMQKRGVGIWAGQQVKAKAQSCQCSEECNRDELITIMDDYSRFSFP
ncbi:hypothetical protein MTR_6g016545 [Medicago truncatula]|uniref:Uncharacterized protein n=1 Tax=Medicago truncatula TaxID=3880 RepID=A0A072U789_MEDTR|nr:hypothetical protein MTR_6g016545 [Medicago truncatula]